MQCMSFQLQVFWCWNFVVNGCGDLPFMHLWLDSTVSLAAGAVLLVGREVGPVMVINCQARAPAINESFESTSRCIQEYFAMAAPFMFRCVLLELCVFEVCKFFGVGIYFVESSYGNLPSNASVIGLDFFVGRWCCLASGTGSWSRHDHKLLSKGTCD